MFCTNCGRLLDRKQRFCGHCGTASSTLQPSGLSETPRQYGKLPHIGYPVVRLRRVEASILSQDKGIDLTKFKDGVVELVLTESHFILSSAPKVSKSAGTIGKVALYTLGPTAGMLVGSLSSAAADKLAKAKNTLDEINDETIEDRFNSGALVMALRAALNYHCYECKASLFDSTEHMVVVSGNFDLGGSPFSGKVVFSADQLNPRYVRGELEKVGISFTSERIKSALVFWERETGMKL